MFDIAPIALSVGARAVLFLVLSWYVYAGADPAAAVDFFQDLFFQSVLITFLSASSFFAVVSKGWDSSKDALLVLTHVLLAVVAVGVILIAYRFVDLGIRPDILFLLLGGAVATGLASPLTGLIVRKHGAWMAYGPSIIAAPACLCLLFLREVDPVMVAILAIVAFQVVVFAALASIARSVFQGILSAIRTMWAVESQQTLLGTFAFGLLNTALVGYFYWFRELWVLSQPAAISAAVLFVFRIFDTLIGIVVTDLGARIHAVALVERHARRLATGVVGISAVAAMLLLALESLTLAPFTLAVSGQILLECVRFPVLVFFLYQGARRSSGGYTVYNVGTVCISFAVLQVFPLQTHVTGFYLFLTVTTVISALLTCAFAILYPSARKESTG